MSQEGGRGGEGEGLDNHNLEAVTITSLPSPTQSLLLPQGQAAQARQGLQRIQAGAAVTPGGGRGARTRAVPPDTQAGAEEGAIIRTVKERRQLHLVEGGEPGPELAPLMPRLVQRRGRSSER